MSELLDLALQKTIELKKIAVTLSGKDYPALQEQLSLHASYSHGKYRYYLRDSEDKNSPRNGRYLNRNDMATAKKIANREYREELNHCVQDQLRILQSLIKNYDETVLTNVYDHLHPGKQLLVTPVILSDQMYAEKWKGESYEGNPHEFSSDEFYTQNNEHVRSKSEVIIADRLAMHGIPYRYEYPLCLPSGKIVYPDFYVLNVRTRRTYYLEHFGRMDDPNYLPSFFWKQANYAEAGLVLGKNYLATYESKDYPLNLKILQGIIREYLL